MDTGKGGETGLLSLDSPTSATHFDSECSVEPVTLSVWGRESWTERVGFGVREKVDVSVMETKVSPSYTVRSSPKPT